MGMNSAPKPNPTMATLIFRLLMLQGSAVAGTHCNDSPEGGIKVSAVPGMTQFLRATVNAKFRKTHDHNGTAPKGVEATSETTDWAACATVQTRIVVPMHGTKVVGLSTNRRWYGVPPLGGCASPGRLKPELRAIGGS